MNMSELADKKCVPCEGNTPPFDTKEIHKYLKKIDGWNVNSDDEKSYFLVKEFKFKNFLESQDFTNKVGIIAEKEGHHPDISFVSNGGILPSHGTHFLSANSLIFI